MSTNKLATLITFIVLGSIGLLALVLAIESDKKSIHITPQVRGGEKTGAYIVTNGDSFDWTNVEIGVSTTPNGPFYGKKLSRVKAGETVVVALKDMTKDGERFNSATQVALICYVQCETSQGRGWWSGSWEERLTNK